MAHKVSLVTVEMADGTVHDAVRLTLQDRLRLERAAGPNNWELANPNHTPSVNSFLAWSALTRTAAITCTYEEFKGGECVDVFMDVAEAVLGDPTQTAASTD